jgi:hypothetical protein
MAVSAEVKLRHYPPAPSIDYYSHGEYKQLTFAWGQEITCGC